MKRSPAGSLIIIGGGEAKEDEPEILAEVAGRVGRDGRLVVVTAATRKPEEVAATYREVFGACGVAKLGVLDIRTREQAADPAAVEALDDAAVIFFTGGDQLRITSQLGGTPVFQKMQALYERGGTIAGTSAGAAAMPSTMLISGTSDSSQSMGGLGMAPGLGFLDHVVIDSHFAERGRIGRLLGAVAQNPQNLGLGIDEDTAILVEGDGCFRVLGSGAVYVVDGTTMHYSSLSEERQEGVVTIHGVTLHVLGAGDCFDLRARRPLLDAPASGE
jgi:cyanophycinase